MKLKQIIKRLMKLDVSKNDMAERARVTVRTITRWSQGLGKRDSQWGLSVLGDMLKGAEI